MRPGSKISRQLCQISRHDDLLIAPIRADTSGAWAVRMAAHADDAHRGSGGQAASVQGNGERAERDRASVHAERGAIPPPPSPKGGSRDSTATVHCVGRPDQQKTPPKRGFPKRPRRGSGAAAGQAEAQQAEAEQGQGGGLGHGGLGEALEEIGDVDLVTLT